MKRRFTAYPQFGIKASKRIYSASNISDFEINGGGRLVRYAGPGGDVVIPNNVTSIGEYAFRDCTSLASVLIPNGVTSIGYSAFSGCTSLVSIIIPDSVTSIDRMAFYGCTSLTSITIPDSVTDIDRMTFSGCISLSSIEIPDSVISIRSGAFFSCVSLKRITIPDSVTSIEEYAFARCTSLINVTIGTGVTSIGVSAFEGCNKLPQDTKNYISQFYDNDDAESGDDDEYEDDEMSFQDWYDSDQGQGESMEFVEILEGLVRGAYDVQDFFEEPSTQGYQGGDFIWITLSDGSKYEFEFDWNAEQSGIYEDGPEAAAKSYFKEIQEGIDSGSALVE